MLIKSKYSKNTRYTCPPTGTGPTTDYVSYGPPGTKCDSGFATPLVNPSLDACYTYCSLYGPTSQQLPIYINYLFNANPSVSSPECFCCGSTCQLVPVNTRRLIGEERGDEKRTTRKMTTKAEKEQSDEAIRHLAADIAIYGAYQILILATFAPTEVPTEVPTAGKGQ